MIKMPKLILGIVCGLLLFFVSLQSLSFTMDPMKKETTPSAQMAPSATPVVFDTVPDINDLPLQDNKELYKNDDPSSVVVMYLTVRKGNASENTHYTWLEVNSFNKWLEGSRSADMVVGAAEAIVQFGDESGPLPGELGYETVVPNATIQIRGASSSGSKNQKSYKIELFKGVGKWRGQSTFALNKHIYELSRVRNKLNFDLMKQIPNMVSLRTQFVHLYVKDETSIPVSKKFVDYGLFTQVEQVNRTFLENHLLDRNAQLYKATSFDFAWDKDLIRNENDRFFNEEAFSNKLEIKGNRDHSKLIQMLRDINNEEIPIERSFEKYFNLDNYFTWMAFNILVGNVDTQNQNFFLYSPVNSNKWYFLPWDYDDSFFRQRRTDAGEYPYLRWEQGIANYWGGPLHNRVLRSEKYRLMLNNKINELMKFLTPDRIEGLLKIYRPVTEPIAFSLPDVNHLPGPKKEYDLAFSSLIPSEVQNNYQLYLESWELPMPFYLGSPIISGDILKFEWDEPYNFKPQQVTYHFAVSKDPGFKNIIYKTDILNVPSIETSVFEPGAYYWRVTVTNEDGKEQYAFDAYEGADGYAYDGVKYFSITPSGDVMEDSN
jgi:spore coat protein H